MKALIENAQLLEWIRFVIFIGFFAFATSYLIPKGIISFAEWRESRVYLKLIKSVAFCVSAALILVYLLATMIIDYARILK